MTWFVSISNVVAVEENEASTPDEAVEVASLKFIEWIDCDDISWQIRRWK